MRTPLVVLMGTALAAAGCGYQLQGRAISGGFGTAILVHPQDARLGGAGVSGVRVQLVRDPDRMRREVVAETVSDAQGDFTLRTSSFGTGWMDERWEIVATRSGYGTAQSRMELPLDASAVRVLVELEGGGR
jgi:hypothetical protein